MIINIKDNSKFDFINKIFIYLRNLYLDLLRIRVENKLIKDSEQLESYFKLKFPQFKKDSKGNLLCVSCDLCQDVCPSQSIEIKKANMINMPSTLKTGEAPMHFYLNTQTCTKCNLCAEVCVVNALELKAKYSYEKVDLVNQA